MIRRVFVSHLLRLLYLANVHVNKISLVILVECPDVFIHQSLHEIVDHSVALANPIIRRPVGEDVADPRNNAEQFPIIIGTFLENHSSCSGPGKVDINKPPAHSLPVQMLITHSNSACCSSLVNLTPDRTLRKALLIVEKKIFGAITQPSSRIISNSCLCLGPERNISRKAQISSRTSISSSEKRRPKP